ncbi:MAG: carbohydrate ABC transporter permease [Christensenellales bacterium]|jgi:inositol-phosphate transport system permease protein
MKKNNAQAYIFMSPFLILVTLLYIIPAILTVIMAFTGLDSSFQWAFEGVKNFRRVFRDPNTPQIILNTVIYVTACISVTIVVDLFFAIMTTYFIKKERFSNFFKGVLMIPMITPVVVYSVLWVWLLSSNSSGFMNKIFMGITGAENPVNWIAKYPMQVVIIAKILTSVAFGTINFSSAIKSIPENQFKAARVDGAKEWEIVKSIIIPNLRFHILFIALWETLGLLTDYTTILLITDGGPGIASEVWALSAYHKAFISTKYGYGAAISLLLIAVVLIVMIAISIVINQMERREENVWQT